MLFTGEDT